MRTRPAGAPAARSAVRALARRVALTVPPVRRLLDDRDRARERARAASAELARIRRLVTVERDDLDYVFVVTYGRSGSTLVQGLLNAIDGYQIRGENNGATIRLYRYWATLEQAHRELRGRAGRPEHPWYGVDGFDPDATRTRIRQLVLSSILRPVPGVRVTGFKEIRWWPTDYRRYMHWMHETFPRARFVVNTRSHDAVLASKWWADKDPVRARQQLKDYEQKLDTLVDMFPDDTFRLHYDDYVADPSVLQGLYRWLGEPWDPARVARVLERKHSY